MSKNKNDQDLKRQIKEMEDKARADAVTAAGAQAQSPESDEGMSYDQWWMCINRKVKMRPHLKEIILVDFMARGLTKKETEQKYDSTLRVFGINW